eukprot:scaffold16426_cov22-Tisochrysis_lutea.AAC.1
MQAQLHTGSSAPYAKCTVAAVHHYKGAQITSSMHIEACRGKPMPFLSQCSILECKGAQSRKVARHTSWTNMWDAREAGPVLHNLRKYKSPQEVQIPSGSRACAASPQEVQNTLL